MDEYKQYPLTTIAFCLVLSFAGSFLQIEFQPIDWLFFGVFIVCEMLFFMMLEKTVNYCVHENQQVKKIRLTMYETMEKAEDHFSQIDSLLTQQRNQTIREEIQLLLMSDTKKNGFYSTETIQTAIENNTMMNIIQNSSMPRKYKRWCRQYIKKYNNNTADFDELKIEYKTKELLKNQIDLKAVIGFVSGLIFGLIGIISAAAFFEYLHARIINIVIMAFIDFVHAFEQYRNQKRFYLKFYSEKNSMIKDILAIIEQNKVEDQTNGQTENAQSE